MASLDIGGYYKINQYNYNTTIGQHAETTPARFSLYPAFLVYQGFETLDGNTRLTLRLLKNINARQPLRISILHHQHGA